MCVCRNVLIVCVFLLAKFPGGGAAEPETAQPAWYDEYADVGVADFLSPRLGENWFFALGKPREDWPARIPETATAIRLAGPVDLDDFAGSRQAEGAEGVLYHRFHSDRKGLLPIGMACDWWFEAFLNGSPCYRTFPGGNLNGNYSPENHPFWLPVQQGGNLLAVRVRRGSQSWRFVCGPVLFRWPDIPRVQYGPWLSDPDAGRMSVRFGSTGPVGSGVEYRERGLGEWRRAWHRIDDRIARRRFHTVHLEGLAEGAEYEYRIVMVDPARPENLLHPQGDTIHAFKAPDAVRTKFSFLFTADLHMRDTDVLDGLLDAADADTCDFLVFGGDIVDNAVQNMESDLVRLFARQVSARGGTSRPLVMLRGNHELRGRDSDRYLEYFGNPGGTAHGLFRFGDTAFLALDSWEGLAADTPGVDYCRYNLDDVNLSAQKEFLAKALATDKWLSAKRRVVLAHGASYSHYAANPFMTERMAVLTDPYFKGVDPPQRLALWLSGHIHQYTRSLPGTDGLAALEPPRRPHRGGRDFTFPVLTGAGPGRRQPQASAFRVDADEEGFIVRAFSPDGRCFDKIRVSPSGRLEELMPLPHFQFE